MLRQQSYTTQPNVLPILPGNYFRFISNISPTTLVFLLFILHRDNTENWATKLGLVQTSAGNIFVPKSDVTFKNKNCNIPVQLYVVENLVILFAK